ncbi:murein hydrolase activator EnvC family protein [Metabacillus arenae]|uniref:Peptidoglycan DD-metalloendopeptidase family protein n=1 Tax=Metabacillus arenae TaxID=2771434 RepID=A0A926NK32_9BACI|nr:peptidoglycan DD-metalloendopeptidase family protein [Metabacillus arenae]MBD1381413.1 peptidoglycan DD-metalloendopeptidase family protein [Metabacillus arenae]
MNRKLLILGLTAVIGTSGTLIPLKHEKAHAYEDLDKQKEEIEGKKSENNSNMESKKKEINELQDKQDQLDADIKSIDMKVTSTNEQIIKKQEEIDATKKEIEQLKVEIDEIKQRIEKRNELLKDRVRSLQQGGGVVSYLDVLLGAQDFSDFVSRISAVTTIVEADKDILKEHENDLKLLEQKEAELSSELKNLETALTELETLKNQLKAQQAEKAKLMEEVRKQHKSAESDLYELEDEAAFLAEQEKAIKLEEQRRKQAEEEEKRRKAEEAAAAAAAKQQAASAPKAANASSNAGSSSSSSSSEPASAPAVTSGDFMWPANGRLSSGYGQRWGKLHAGVDIANSIGTPVVASAAGTVIRSYYSSSYGNVVFLTHNINGKVYTTVYAHLSARQVSAGQSVSKGQQIGLLGNTGDSTGPHLHFEIHNGAWKNPVDPMNFLP